MPAPGVFTHSHRVVQKPCRAVRGCEIHQHHSPNVRLLQAGATSNGATWYLDKVGRRFGFQGVVPRILWDGPEKYVESVSFVETVLSDIQVFMTSVQTDSFIHSFVYPSHSEGGPQDSIVPF